MSDILCEHEKYKHTCEACAEKNTWGIVSVFEKVGVADALIYGEKLEQENAKLREELAGSQRLVYDMQFQINELHEQLRTAYPLSDTLQHWKQRAEAAEAKLKAASGQEPVRLTDAEWVNIVNNPEVTRWDLSKDEAVHLAVKMVEEKLRQKYAAPIPPADVQENGSIVVKQMKRIAELERKLAEQRALNKEIDACLCRHLYSAESRFTGSVGSEELNTLLVQAREEGRKEAIPDGWQVVPKGPDSAMLLAGKHTVKGMDNGEFESEIARCTYLSMLAAAPNPITLEQP